MSFLGLTAGAASAAAGAGVSSGITSSISGLMSGAIGGLFSGIKNRKAHKRNKEILKLQNGYEIDRMKLQQEMNKEQAEFNQGLALQMFDYTSKYNSPAEQVKRLKEAGLNPALMYAGGGGGGAGQGSTAGAGVAGGVTALQPLGLQLGLQAEMQMAQIEALRAETYKTRVEAGAIGVDISKTKSDTENSKKLTEEQIKKLREDIRVSGINSKEQEFRNEILKYLEQDKSLGQSYQELAAKKEYQKIQKEFEEEVAGGYEAQIRGKIAVRLLGDFEKVIKAKFDEMEIIAQNLKKIKEENKMNEYLNSNERAVGDVLEMFGGDDKYASTVKAMFKWFFGGNRK